MLQCKSKKIISEINDFFTSSEKAIKKTIEVYKALRLHKLKISENIFAQSQYDKSDILLCLLLQPLFALKNVRQYVGSELQLHINAGKDTLYRFKNNSKNEWRKLSYKLNRIIYNKITESGTADNTSPRCLIIDDSDLPKKGKLIEHISRIWSHVVNQSILGFKGLFLCYWDSKSFMALDFSLHKEKGKNQKYPYGLKPSVLKKQYKKRRSKKSAGYARIQELERTKIETAISMIQRARRHKIIFDYVLTDSWFVCDKMIKYVTETGSHLLGMAKMGNSKYSYKDKEYSAKELAVLLKRNKKDRKLKRLGLYISEVIVEFKEVPVKLFLSRTSKRGNWHLLLSTNTNLAASKAYETYAIRWSIEVFFKECKTHFQLGKSQSRDFDAQIADVTISMIQYNIFSLAKRFSDYETLGELFKDAKDSAIELTISKRLWLLFLELINIIADFAEIDMMDIMKNIIQDGNSENKLIKMLNNSLANAA